MLSKIRENFIFLLIPTVIWFIYMGTFIYHRPRILSDDFNYFKDLAKSFSQGRLDVNVSSTSHDLVLFKGKYYLYWPPVPALIYMPFTALWAKNTPDTIIANSFGALNVLLLMILLNLFSKRYQLKLSRSAIAFLAVFWAAGTVHFYMSMMGSVWYVSQIMAQTFLMLSIICILINRSSITLFLSGLFYAMAVYTKNDLLFTIFLIAAIHITNNNKNKRTLLKNLVIFLMPFVVFTLTNMAYNWLRFGSVFDNGIKYHRMALHFSENFKKYGYLSLHYAPGNFVREVIIPPPLAKQFPFFKFNPEGFGFLWASPLFILIFVAAFYYKNGVRKHFLKHRVNTIFSYNDIIVMSGAAVSSILIAFLIFMIMGTGWVQFASRYSLDYQLMMLLFGLFVIKKWNNNKIFNAVLIILLLFSIYMNYSGMKFYLNFENRHRRIFSTAVTRPFMAKKSVEFYG